MPSDNDPGVHMTAAETVVTASPEQVWQAIATGTGNAAWLFAAEIEPHEGGAMVIRREPFASDAVANVTAWDPPRRFAYEEPIQPGASGPNLATEFLVEARRGGTCVVRVVSGLHSDSEGWEDLVEGTGEGWRLSLTVLRSYLTHFTGQPASHLDVITSVGRPLDHGAEVFADLMSMLGLTGVAAGDAFHTPQSAPPLAGIVEHVTVNYVLLRATTPCPALIPISTFPMDGATLTINVSGRIYGPDAGVVVRREQPRWEAWLSERFPVPSHHTS